MFGVLSSAKRSIYTAHSSSPWSRKSHLSFMTKLVTTGQEWSWVIVVLNTLHRHGTSTPKLPRLDFYLWSRTAISLLSWWLLTTSETLGITRVCVIQIFAFHEYIRDSWCQTRSNTCASKIQGCLPQTFSKPLPSAGSYSSVFLRSQHPSLPGNPGSKADRLRRDSKVLDRARLCFRDVITFIERRNALDWPSCKLPKEKAAVELIMETLLVDFKDLDNEATSLSQACNDSIGLEMNMVSILDSKKSIEQADRVQKLTFLAYLFVPMSFITGIFWMNVKEINGSSPKLWLYFAVAIPLAICFTLIPLWKDIRRLLARAWLCVRHMFLGYSTKV